MKLKQKILMDFLANPSQTLSGQQLCEKYAVSRTAVWKAIQSLKQDGYEIEATPHAGYHLIKYDDWYIRYIVLIPSIQQTTMQNVY